MISVACCQMEPQIGDMDGNLEKTLYWIDRGVADGANLIVLPELCVSGYVLRTREEAYDLSECVPEGRAVRSWEEKAEENEVYIVGGLAERDKARLYNTSVIVGPDGYIGKYRKLHLWFEENLFFEPGDLGLPIFYTSLGRVAMMVCYDMWFSELPRIYAIKGADIIVIPTNWPESRSQDRIHDITDKLLVAHAHINGVYIAACDRVGSERGMKFKGRSIIVSQSGEILSGPASDEREEMIISELDFANSRIKRKNRFNDILGDRRKDVYHDILG